jgi:hypothetical protein
MQVLEVSDDEHLAGPSLRLARPQELLLLGVRHKGRAGRCPIGRSTPESNLDLTRANTRYDPK